MLLAIDCGNTNIVFAVFSDDGTIRGEWRSSTDSHRTADEFGVWLDQLMAINGIDRNGITSAIIATVVPANLFSLRMLCRNYFDVVPLVIGSPDVKLGLELLVDRPEDVGADRVVNAVSAYDTYGGPLIIVDFGTATTLDLINGDGDYMGGVILPGVNLSLEALHLAAAQLPRVAIHRPERVIGKGTVEAMQSGIYFGYVSMIEGFVKRIVEEYGSPVEVIATGGLSSLFTEATDCIKTADPDLTLRGLYAIYQRNT